MRELNGVSFQEQADIKKISELSKEFCTASHGGTKNFGETLSSEKLVSRYESNAETLKVGFSAFFNNVLRTK
jgi:hypothetical protein